MKSWFGAAVIFTGCIFSHSDDSAKLTGEEKAVIGGWEDTLFVGQSPDILFLRIDENKSFTWDFANGNRDVYGEWKGTWSISSGKISLVPNQCQGEGKKPAACSVKNIIADVSATANSWQAVFQMDSTSTLLDFARVY